MRTCSRDIDAHQTFEFDHQWQQLRSVSMANRCLAVDDNFNLVMHTCLDAAQDDAERVRRQRFVWQRAFKTVRSSVALDQCFEAPTSGSLGAPLALRACTSIADYLQVVSFLPPVVGACAYATKLPCIVLFVW